MRDIIIGRVSHRAPHPKNIESVNRFMAYLVGQGLDVALVDAPGVSMVCHARSALCTIIKERHPCGMVMLIDDDISWDEWSNANVYQVAQEAAERKAVVGAAYPQKQFLGKVAADFASPLKLDCYAAGRVYGPRDGLIGVGMGCVAFPTVMLFEMAKRIPKRKDVIPFFARELTDDEWWGEDYSFCRQALRAGGYQTFLDTRPRLYHWGQHAYSLEDCGQAPERHEQLRLNLRPGPAPDDELADAMAEESACLAYDKAAT